jgi:hypothetical protein
MEGFRSPGFLSSTGDSTDSFVTQVPGNLTVDSTSYRIDLACSSADTLSLTFLESGFWHWDSLNSQYLFFDYQASNLEIMIRIERRSLILTERHISRDTTGGAWYCKYSLGDGRITLFDTAGGGAARFDRIVLTAE